MMEVSMNEGFQPVPANDWLGGRIHRSVQRR
jgi:hypothetical protein